ncbi:MAG: SGNH/GDSL hydrolase family protein [Bacillota bacterium]|nr:SGNH/GDSL hydrolase family protein [Bacillota bacterium]
MLNKTLLGTLTLIASLLTLLWLSGFGWAMAEYYSGKPGNLPSVNKTENVRKQRNELTVLALGDSLTRGTGDATGKGYVGDLIDEMKSKSKMRVNLLNLGVNGQRSDQLQKQIQQREVLRQIGKSDIILLTIGGNDLFRGGQGLSDYQKVNIAVIEKTYLRNLTSTLQQIRQHNKDARVFFVGLYNPFIDLNEGKDISKVIRRWNYDSAEVSATFPKVVFVPTFDLFELKVNDYLFSDKFHPNSKGYRLIAERVASLITW